MKQTIKNVDGSNNKPISNWKEKAEFRIKNRKWLNYSSNIARRVAAALEEKRDLTQKSLAESLNVSPQYVSKLLKGEENLTLETIAKLSTALDIELIKFPDYKYSVPVEHIKFYSKVIRMEMPAERTEKKQALSVLMEGANKYEPSFRIGLHNNKQDYISLPKLHCETSN